jgi:hypothetical protein
MAFSKGTSGNPAGRAKGTVTRATLEKQRRQKALAILEAALADNSLSPEARIKAASVIYATA